MNKIIRNILKNNFVEYRKEKGHFEIVSEICSESSTPLKIGNNWYSLEDFSSTFKFPNKEPKSVFYLKDSITNKSCNFIGLNRIEKLFSKEPDYILKEIENIPEFKNTLVSLKVCYQNPIWHAEGAIIENGIVKKCGTVYDHIKVVMEEMWKLEHDWLDMFAAFIHDIGKPECLRINGCKTGECWPMSADHDIRGVPIAEELCRELGFREKDINTIKWLVENHMKAHKIVGIKSKYRKWCLISHPDFNRLIKLSTCDSRGCLKMREDLWIPIDDAIEKEEIKQFLGKKMPKRILTKRYLLKRGFKPNRIFEFALEKAYEFQIDKDIKDKEKLFHMVKPFFSDKNLKKKLES